MNMKKVTWYLMIVLVGMFACKSQTIQPEAVNFEFNGESTGNASFSVSQLTSDKKTKLLINVEPIKLKITTKEQLYDLKSYVSSANLKAQIEEYQEPLKGILPEIPPPLNAKPNPVTKTWKATEGTVLIQLIKGQPQENNQCRNEYIVTVKLSDVKFITTDSEQIFILKSHIFKDYRVGWCPL
jgi:hypothetical protein